MVLSFLASFCTLPWLIFTSLLTIFVYQFIVKSWSFFSDNNVKFNRGLPFLGTTYRTILGRESMSDVFHRLYNEFPNERIFGIFDFGGTPKYVIRDPELIKQITIKDFDHFTNHMLTINEDADPFFGRSLIMMRDQRWKDMRSILSPAFTGSKMRLMCGLLTEVCENFCKSVKNEKRVIECDVKDIFSRYANDAIASCAFGISIDSIKDRDNEFYKSGQMLANFDFGTLLLFLAYIAMPKVMNTLKLSILKKKMTDYFRKVVLDNINYREKNNVVRNDMINMLIEVKKGMLSAGTDLDDEDRELLQSGKSGNSGSSGSDAQLKWTDDDLIAQCMIFFLAGFQTVSLTLGFAAHELTVNPDIQAKLYEEIQEVKRKLNGKPLNFEELQKMKYLDMILNETLRRWPQNAVTDRLVSKTYIVENFDGTKVQLNPGDGLWLNVIGLQMDPKYFPNPEQFIPERFSDENKHKIFPGTYMPFGVGPRSCIASRFALMECKAFLYYLVDNFKLEISAKTQHPLKYKTNSGSVEAENGFWMILRDRV